MNHFVQVGAGQYRWHDGGGVRVVAQFSAQRVAVFIGHEVINDGDVKFAFERLFHCLGGIGGDIGHIAATIEQLSEFHARGGRVVHHQDTDGHIGLDVEAGFRELMVE